MKKTKIFSALALASCVMLTGCKNKEKPEEPSVPDPSMVISDLPARVHVGDSVNLDSYVSLTSLSAFTVEIAEESEDLVSISGHTVTVVGEGEIKFTVKAGEFSQDCTVTSVYAIRDELAAYFKDVGRKYTVDIFEPVGDEETGEVTGFEWSDTLEHSDNYIFSWFSWSYEASGGFLRFGENDPDAYEFSVPFDEEEEEEPTRLSREGEEEPATPEIELGDMVSPFLLDLYNSEFSSAIDFFDLEKAVVDVDEETGKQYLCLSGDDAADFADNSLFGSDRYGSSGKVIASVNEVDFHMVDIAEEGQEPEIVAACNVYIDYQGQTYIDSIAQFDVDQEHAGEDFLDAFCVPANKPAYKDYCHDMFWQGIDLTNYFPSDQAQQSVFGASGMMSVMYGWFDGDGEAVTEFDDKTFFGVADKMPAGSKSYFTSANSIYEYALNGNTPYPVSGRTTVIDDSGEEPVKEIYNVYKTDDGYIRELDSESTSVWDAPEFFPAFRDERTWLSGAIASVESSISLDPEPYEEEEEPSRLVHRDGDVTEPPAEPEPEPVDPEPSDPEPEYDPTMPSAYIGAYLSYYTGAQISVPDYAIAAENGGFEFDEESVPGYLDVYVYNSIASEMDDYAEDLQEAGWLLTGKSEDGDYRLQVPGTTAVVDLLNYGDYILLSFTIVTPVHNILLNSWRANAFFEALYEGIPGMDYLKETVEWYAGVSGGQNLLDFFKVQISINEAGQVVVMASFSWSEDLSYMVGIMWQASASGSYYCAQFDELTAPQEVEPQA